MKISIVSIMVLSALISGTQAKAQEVCKETAPANQAKAQEFTKPVTPPAGTFTDYLGFGHTYKVGDHVIASYAFERYDATIDSVAPDGTVLLRFPAMPYTDEHTTNYSLINPYKPISKYTTRMGLGHTYRIGDRVTVPILGKNESGKIEQLTEDGLVKMHFDNEVIQDVFHARYVDVGNIEPVVAEVKVAENKVDADCTANKNVVAANSNGGTGPTLDNIPSQNVPAR